MTLSNLHDWVFNYNTYTGLWNAAKREDYHLLFSSGSKHKVLRSKEIETLITLISRSEDNTKKGIDKYVKGQVKHVIVEG
jgi:hypothetical protein